MKKNATEFAIAAGFDITDIDSPHSSRGWYSSRYDPDFKTFIKFKELVVEDCIRILKENGYDEASNILKGSM